MSYKASLNNPEVSGIQQELGSHGRNTPHISSCLNGVSTLSRLVDVIDGDTIVCVVPLLGHYFKFNVRLKGIDTCEMKSKDPILRERAVAAREYLVRRLLDEKTTETDRKTTQQYLDEKLVVVYLHCYDFDKYGRLLADVYINNESTVSLSDELIHQNLAYPYDGGKKIIPENDEH